MSATLFAVIDFGLFFAFILAAGLWQLRELERDRKRLQEDRELRSEEID